MFPRKFTRTKKPNSPVQLDKSNQIARKFDFYLPLGANDRNGLDVVGDLSPTVDGTDQAASTLGIVKEFTDPSTYDFGDVHDVGADDFTVGCWFKTTQSGAQSLATKARLGPQDHRWGLNVGGGGDLQFFIIDSSGYYCGSTMVWDDGEWHFVTATLARGVGLELYVDGVSVATLSYTGTTDLNCPDVMVVGEFGNPSGTAPHSGAQQYLGLMSDFFLCHSALSHVEVKSLYNNFYQIYQPRTQLLPLTTGAAPTGFKSAWANQATTVQGLQGIS